MTLIIAAESKNCIIVGCDGRGTYGRETKVCVQSNKWFPVSKHVIILSAGDGDLNHSIITQFIDKIKGEDGITNITNKFIDFCRSIFEHTKNFHFEDDNISLDKKRFEQILDKIIEGKLNIRWDVPNGMRADTLDFNLYNKLYFLFLSLKQSLPQVTFLPFVG